jgi:hypothetical protein
MFGFVYIWRDRLTKRYYIGSHLGAENDGYVCSNKWMLAAFRKRPEDFKRRIIWRLESEDYPALLLEEQRWLNMIRDDELATSESVSGQRNRYYNFKKTAAGGNGRANLGKSKPAWNRGLTKDMLELRRDGLFMLLCDKPKHRKEPRKPNVCQRCSTEFFGKSRLKYCSRSCASQSRWLAAKTRTVSEETKKKMSGKIPWNKGTKMSEEAKQKLSESRKGSVPWNKGLPNPLAADNGKKSAAKQSASVTGRRRQYRDDGSWFWIYPEK